MKQKITTLLLLLSILSLCVCSGLIYHDYHKKAAADAALEAIGEMKPPLKNQGTEEPSGTNPEQIPTDQTDGHPSLSVMDFAKIKAVNADVVAWLTIPDTQIDYPVVQGRDNAYYLNHDVKKRSNKNGTLFLDYRVHADFSDFNSVVYGHHMKNANMFHNLTLFKDKSFWDSHPSATLYTQDFTYRVEIFAAAVIKQDSALYEYAFASPAERMAHLDEIRSCAMFYRDIGVTETDRIVTLSTCSYEFSGARYIVLGVLRPT